VEDSFRALFDLHGRAVMGWLLVRVPRDQADDLFQEIWSTFYLRWRAWESREHLAAPEARPVLSFLFRTAAFVRNGQYRRKRALEPVEEAAAIPDAASGPEVLDRRVQLGRCLELAAEVCSPEEQLALWATDIVAGYAGSGRHGGEGRRVFEATATATSSAASRSSPLSNAAAPALSTCPCRGRRPRP
jgi:DNA-directed RNA polymerase specialized sigma24 family protein